MPSTRVCMRVSLLHAGFKLRATPSAVKKANFLLTRLAGRTLSSCGSFRWQLATPKQVRGHCSVYLFPGSVRGLGARAEAAGRWGPGGGDVRPPSHNKPSQLTTGPTFPPEARGHCGHAHPRAPSKTARLHLSSPAAASRGTPSPPPPPPTPATHHPAAQCQ